MMIDAILVYSPEKELEVLARLAGSGEKIDWKPAIILSAAYLEKFGAERLKKYYENKEIKPTRKLEKLSLYQITKLLYELNLIKRKHFTLMNRVRAERNKLVHPKGILPAYVGEEANKKYGKMIREALGIIQFLKSEKKE